MNTVTNANGLTVNKISNPIDLGEPEFIRTFEIAKKAISFVGLFRTPPTPQIYSMWYSYAEGSDRELTARLSYHVNEIKSIDELQLGSILKDLSSKDSEATLEICDSLSDAAQNLRATTNAQIAASKEFGATVAKAATSLNSVTSLDVISDYVSQIVASHNTLHFKLEDAESKLEETISKVESLSSQLADMQQELMRDSLTGVGNRSYFDKLVRQALANRGRESQYYFLMLVDLDEFKNVNDVYGHRCGDAILRYVGKELQRCTSEHSIARIGGDEFAVVVKGDNENHGRETAAELVKTIAAKQLKLADDEGLLGRVTVSVGVAIMREDDTQDSWFDRADKLLYNAKAAGRNCSHSERSIGRSIPTFG